MEIKLEPPFALEVASKLINDGIPFTLEHTRHHTVIVVSKKDLETLLSRFGKLQLVVDNTKGEQ